MAHSPSVTNDYTTMAIPKWDLYGKMSYSSREKYFIEKSHNVHYETTGNVTVAEYTSSLDIFYVMCYKEIKDISLPLQWRSI